MFVRGRVVFLVQISPNLNYLVNQSGGKDQERNQEPKAPFGDLVKPQNVQGSRFRGLPEAPPPFRGPKFTKLTPCPKHAFSLSRIGLFGTFLAPRRPGAQKGSQGAHFEGSHWVLRVREHSELGRFVSGIWGS